jgi:xanthine dehydrogenase accessory factor
MSLHRLIPLFARARLSDEPLVLATVIRTAGSTYAKPGALMLIAGDGEYAGLLSGGCLESDLREHARAVIETRQSRVVSYDMRSPDDQLFGLGAGCEGAMDILLTCHGPAAPGWQTLTAMENAWRQGRPSRIAFVCASENSKLPLGMNFPVNGAGAEPAAVEPWLRSLHSAASHAAHDLLRVDSLGVELFVASIASPPRLLLLGGGPDAGPVTTLAAFLGWRLTVADHRAAYLAPARFAADTELVEVRPAELAARLPLDRFDAAVIMSHHLDSDLHYLRALARSQVPYVGLLGPAARREKLLADLGADADALHPRLRAPVGLDIGGREPESIALSIIGEVHAMLAGRGGRPFSETSGADPADPGEHAR